MRKNTTKLLRLDRRRKKHLASRIRSIEVLENRILLAADFDFAGAVILAQEKVDIKKGSTILAGDGDSFGDVIVNIQGGEIKFDKDVSTGQGVRLVGDKIVLDKDTSILGDVFFNELKSMSTIAGAQNAPLIVPVFSVDAWPEFHASAPGNLDIEVASGATRTIVPGAYGKIELSKNATLILDGNGIFDVEKIELDEGASLLLLATDNVEVRVADQIKAKKDARLGPAAGASVDASSIIFYVTSGSAKFEKNGVVNATIFVHQGNIDFKENTKATGAFIAKEVKIEKDSVLQFDSYYSQPQDRTSPTVLLLSPIDGSLTNQNVTIAGVASDDLSGVVLVEAQMDSGALFPVVFDAAGNFSFDTTFPLNASADGSHIVRLRATDQAGNASGFSKVTFTLDSVAPTVTITGPQDGLITNQNVSLSGLVSDNLSGVSTLRGLVNTSVCMGPFLPNASCSQVTVDAAGNFNFDTSLPLDGTSDGVQNVRFLASDVAGNASASSQVIFTLDTILPTAQLALAVDSDTGQLGDGRTALDRVTVIGQTEPTISVMALAGLRTTQSDALGRFAFDNIPLDVGVNRVDFQLIDTAGNSALVSIMITREIGLIEGNQFRAFFEWPIEVPTQPSYIEVTYGDLQFDESAEFVNDAFEISLVDGQGRSLVHTITGSSDAAFNVTEGESAVIGANTLQSEGTIKIDLSHIPAGMHGTVIARLLNNDADTTTSVLIHSVNIVDGSLGTRAGGSIAGTVVGHSSEINFERLTDVSGSLNPVYGRTSYSQEAKSLMTQVSISNDGNFAVSGPLIAVFDTLSDPTVRIRDFDGQTPEGKPYYDFTNLLTDESLAAGERTSERLLAFFNRDDLQFTYELIFLGHLNEAPKITTSPNIEVIVDKLYRYEVEAIDADGDGLLYSLSLAPGGMTIDSETGGIQWQPSGNEIGNHSVTLRVDDGHGGVVNQSFTLAVISAPLNRPPVFDSMPIVDAYVGEEYVYDADATDSDGDELQYLVYPNYESAALAAGSAGYWRFDELSGNIAKDISENEIDGTYDAFSESSLGLPGALKDSANTAIATGVTVPDDPRLYKARQRTVMGWFRIDSFFGFNTTPIVTKYGRENGILVYELSLGTESSGRLSFGGGTLSTIKTTGFNYWQFDTWHQFALVINGDVNRLQLFLDGRLVGSTGHPGETPDSNAVWKFGGLSSQLDEFAIYTRALSPEEIMAIYEEDVPNPVSIDHQTGQISWTPTTEQMGDQRMRVTAGDGRGGVAEQDFIIHVGVSLNNHVPVIVSDPVALVGSGSPYRYSVLALDADDDELIYAIASGPTGMQIDPHRGTIQWLPVAADEGIHAVEVAVSDGRAVVTQSFNLEVLVGGIIGTKFYDLNENGLRDPSEPGIAGGIVYLDTNQNGALDPGEQSTITDRNGMYQFAGLSYGDYVVRQHIQPGWIQTGTAKTIFGGLEDEFALPGELLSPTQEFSSSLNWSRASQSDILVGNAFVMDSLTGLPRNLIAARLETRLWASWIEPNTDSLALSLFDEQHTRRTLYNRSLPTLFGEWRLDQKESLVLDLGSIQTAWSPDGQPSSLLDVLDRFSVDRALHFYVQDDTSLDFLRLSAASSDLAVYVTVGGDFVDASFANVESDLTRVNLPPSFLGSPRLTATVGQEFRFEPDVEDPDNDVLRFAAATRLAGMIVDPVTGLSVWVPTQDQVGEQNFALRAMDDRGGLVIGFFTVDVQLPNVSPVITSIPPTTAVAGAPLVYAVRAQDADGDSLQYQLLNSSSLIQLDGDSGVLTWLPNQSDVGLHSVSIVVEDGRGGLSTQQFELEVVASANNQPPFISSTPRTKAAVNFVYRYTMDVIDPDFDPLQLTLTDAPQGMVIDRFGIMTWTPNVTDLGTHTVSVLVDDGRGGEVSQSFTVTVGTNRGNSTPTVTSEPSLNARAGVLYTYDAVASDQDDDPVFWSLLTAPHGMSIDPFSGEVRWVPTSVQSGGNSVLISVTDGQGGIAEQTFAIVVRAGNVPPVITSVAPVVAVVGQTLQYDVQVHGSREAGLFSLQDIDGDQLQFAVSGPSLMGINAKGKLTWTPREADLGKHSILIAVTDGYSSAVQRFELLVVDKIPNSVPEIRSSPNLTATLNGAYEYQVIATDPDQESLEITLLESPPGMTFQASGLIEWTPVVGQEGSHWVRVIATDQEGATAAQRFMLTVSDNEAPTIDSSPVLESFPGRAYRYTVRAHDPNGDSIRFELATAPDGMTIDFYGRVLWIPGDHQIGPHAVQIRVTDEAGASNVQSYVLEVLEDHSPPKVKIDVTPNPALILGRVEIYVNAVDDVQLDTVSLTVDGVPVVLDQFGRSILVPTQAGIRELKATAQDLAGNIGIAEVALAVLDPNDVDAPVVDLTAPSDDAIITNPTEVIGTVSDDNLLFYSLAYAASAGGDFVEFARGTSPVANGVLGLFDPTMLPNDSYLLQLFAVDAGGNKSTKQVRVNVGGDLKIGNFNLSFTDLSIPVSGIPITVTRTYDSLNASSEASFGYGWRLEFADADVRSSVAKTGYESDLIYNAFYDGARVYITVPGGQRQAFTFRLTRAPGIQGSFLGLFNGSFVPDPGVTSTLSAQSAFLQVTATGDAIEYTSALPWNPFSPVFGGQLTLTTREGITYTIDGNSGDLRRVTDRNGNALTFSSGGVASSTGQSISFERDARGRVTAVIDPAGNRIDYRYDIQGDLVSVTDRERNTTGFSYADAGRPHFLTEIIDPLGRSGVRSEYDDSGRLVRMVDADGKVVQLVHDLDNSVETIENQLGHTTTFVYDSFGNVVTEIDAEGLTTRRTYNDPNNVTLETSVTQILADGTELTTYYQYDNRGNVLVETDPLGFQTRFTYNLYGDVTSTTDANGNTTISGYDRNGNLLSTTDADGLANSFSYDTAGNPTSLVVGSNVTTFQYDGAGRVIRQEDAVGTVRTFTYDANGNQLTDTVVFTSASGPSTVVTENTYDEEGRSIASVVKQDGVVLTQSETKYDAVGNRVESIDALGRSTRFIYDDRGQLTETIFPDSTPLDDADNSRTKTIYDAAGQVLASIDEAGAITRYVYDKAGRQVKTVFPAVTAADPDDIDPSDNPFTQTIYDLAGRVVEQTDELGNRTRFIHDKTGNVTATILPDTTPGDDSDNPRLVTHYDAIGRRIASVDPIGNTTKFVYSNSGLLTETILPDATPNDDTDNARTKSAFDDNRRLTARIDANGNKTEYEYDELGRLSAVMQFVTNSATGSLETLRTEYRYDELGNLVTQTDANGHATRFEYDGLGRRTATELPLGQRSTTQYDLAGRVIRSTDFNGQTITFDYDSRDRLIGKHFPDGSETAFTYTVTGQRESASDGRGTTQYQYDARHRLLSRTDPDGAKIEYTYDAAGNRTSVTTQVGTNAPRQTVYTFDPLNRIELITDPEGDTTTYVYDAAGRLIETSFANSTAEFREYDEQNRLTLVEHKNATTDEVFASFAYELDRVGNRTAVTEFGGRRLEYDYDELYRLVSEDNFDSGPATLSRSIDYTYDDVGNRLIRNDTAEGLTSYTYDANDRLLSESEAPLGAGPAMLTTYGYDHNGNTLAKHVNGVDQVFYEWDIENRLVSADTNADGINDVAYEYDADGIRVSKTTNPQGAADETRFLIDANRPYQQVLEEYTPSGILKVSYVHGLDLISQNRHGDTGKSFYHVDGLGSTRALTDASGIVTDSYIYDAFGQTIGQVGSTGNVYLFAGEQRDLATGLDYLRARYMNPSVGRFVGRDPFEGLRNDPVTLHKYLYANANPTRFVDPTGNLSLGELSVTLEVLTSLAVISFAGAQLQSAFGIGSGLAGGFIRWEGRIVSASVGPIAVPLAGGGHLITATSEEFNGKSTTGTWVLPQFGLSLGLPVSVSCTSVTLYSPAIFGANTWVFSGFSSQINASSWWGAPIIDVSATVLQMGFGVADATGLGITFFDVGVDVFGGLAIDVSGQNISVPCSGFGG